MLEIAFEHISLYSCTKIILIEHYIQKRGMIVYCHVNIYISLVGLSLGETRETWLSVSRPVCP